MNRFSAIILTSLILIVNCSKINSQIWENSTINYNTQNGFPTNTIFNITSDSFGFIWLATDIGVIKFDGNDYRLFTTSNGISGNEVLEICCDKFNRIWISTLQNEICYIENDKVFNKDNSILIRSINNKFQRPKFVIDEDSNLWIHTIPFRLIKVNAKSFTNINIPFVPDLFYQALVDKNNLYFISDDDYFYINIHSNIIKKGESRDSLFITAASFNNSKWNVFTSSDTLELDSSVFAKGVYTKTYQNIDLAKDKDGLYFKTNEGCRYYSYKYGIENGLCFKDMSVSSIYSNESVWISTLSHGLFKLYPKGTKNLTLLNDGKYSSFSTLSSGVKYIYSGTTDGTLLVLDKRSLEVKKSIRLKPPNNRIVKIVKVVEIASSLYVSTSCGLYIVDLKELRVLSFTESNQSFKNSYLTQDKLYLLGHDGIGIMDMKNNRKEFYHGQRRFYSFCQYLGYDIFSSEDSLFYFSNNILKQYDLNHNLNSRITDLAIFDSIMIITTSDQGIYFVKGNNIYSHMENFNNSFKELCYKSVVHNKMLYICTKHGIKEFDLLKMKSIRNIGTSEGLISNNVFDIHFINDTLIAATELGISKIPLTNMNNQIITFINPCIIGNDTNWLKVEQLKTNTLKPIYVQFNTIFSGSHSSISYNYRIFSKSFIHTNDRVVKLTFSKPGNYWLEYYAQSSDGGRSRIIRIPITVAPLYYQTLIFRMVLIASILTFIILLFIFIQKYVSQIANKKMEERNKIRALELTVWKSFINPHFMFNSLNTMQAFFQSNSFQKANLYLSNFSSILRNTIDYSNKILIRLDYEIVYLKSYMQLENQKRFKAFHFEIGYNESNILNYFIPSLLIQPVIENSIKHGQKDSLSISINFEFKSNKVQCTITDNGQGLQKQKTSKASNSIGNNLILSKIKIVEGLLNIKIKYDFNNRFDDDGKVIGTITTFAFPLLLEDIADGISFK